MTLTGCNATSGEQSSTPPDWFLTTNNAPNVIYGVGAGKTSSSAKQRAHSDILLQISSRAKVAISKNISTGALAIQSSSAEYTAVSDIQLLNNITMLHQAFANGIYYIKSSISINDVIASIESEITKLSADISYLRTNDDISLQNAIQYKLSKVSERIFGLLSTKYVMNSAPELLSSDDLYKRIVETDNFVTETCFVVRDNNSESQLLMAKLTQLGFSNHKVNQNCYDVKTQSECDFTRAESKYACVLQFKASLFRNNDAISFDAFETATSDISYVNARNIATHSAINQLFNQKGVL